MRGMSESIAVTTKDQATLRCREVSLVVAVCPHILEDGFLAHECLPIGASTRRDFSSQGRWSTLEQDAAASAAAVSGIVIADFIAGKGSGCALGHGRTRGVDSKVQC